MNTPNRNKFKTTRTTTRSLFLIGLLLPLIPAVTSDPNAFPLLSGTLRTFQVHACDGEELTLECSDNTVIAISLVQYGRIPVDVSNNNVCNDRKQNTKPNMSQVSRIHSSFSSPASLERNSVPSFTSNVLLPTPSSSSLSPRIPTLSSSSLIGRSRNNKDSKCISDLETLRLQLLQKVESNCRGKSICTISTLPSVGSGMIDPCPGTTTAKLIEVAYKCKPRSTDSKVACEGEILRLKCRQSSDRIAILSAFYGTSSNSPVPECPNSSSRHHVHPMSTSSSFASSKTSQQNHQQQLRNNLTVIQTQVEMGGVGKSDSGLCQASFATEKVMARCLAQSECTIGADGEVFGTNKTSSCSNKDGRIHLKVIYSCVTGRVLRNFSFSPPPSSVGSFSVLQTMMTNSSSERGGRTDYSGFVDAPRYDPTQEKSMEEKEEENGFIRGKGGDKIPFPPYEQRRKSEESIGNTGHRHVTPILSSSSSRNPSSSSDSSSAISARKDTLRKEIEQERRENGRIEPSSSSSSSSHPVNESFPSSSSFSFPSSPTTSEEVKRGVKVMSNATRLEATSSSTSSFSFNPSLNMSHGVTSSNGKNSSTSNTEKKEKSSKWNEHPVGRRVVSFGVSIYNLFKVYSEEIMLFILMAISISCLGASLVFLTMILYNKKSMKSNSPKDSSSSSNDSLSPSSLSPSKKERTGSLKRNDQQKSCSKGELYHSIEQQKISPSKKCSQGVSSSFPLAVFDATNEQLLEDLQNEGLVRSPTLCDYKHEDKGYNFLPNQLLLPLEQQNKHVHNCPGDTVSFVVPHSHSHHQLNSYNSHVNTFHHSNSFVVEPNSKFDTLNGQNTYGSYNHGNNSTTTTNLVYPLNHYPSTSSTPVSSYNGTTASTSSNQSEQQLVPSSSSSYKTTTLTAGTNPQGMFPAPRELHGILREPSLCGTLNRRTSQRINSSTVLPIPQVSFTNTTSFASPSKEVVSKFSGEHTSNITPIFDALSNVSNTCPNTDGSMNNSYEQGVGGQITLQRVAIGNTTTDNVLRDRF